MSRLGSVESFLWVMDIVAKVQTDSTQTRAMERSQVCCSRLLVISTTAITKFLE